ncbi:YhdP family phospholipid transporter [Congregibacter sp.]|uniref:YhdP family phospholipid transporter n=1 Tax=Congregibacter sp. TaxID=2744308 RepID=UPI003F6AB8AF
MSDSHLSDRHSGETHHGESLPLRGFHALAPWAWRLLVFLVVLLAIYVAAGRFFMQQIPALRDPVLELINRQLPFTVSVESLSGGWNAFSPELNFTELRITQDDPQAPPIAIGRGSLRLDIPGSVLAGSLQLSRMDVAGLAVDARLTEEGAIEVVGFTPRNGVLKAWLEDFLPNVQRVALAENQLKLITSKGRVALAVDLLLEREGNARRLHGMVEGESIALEVNAEGVGSPLRPLSWTGDVFVDARSSDLAALSAFWETLDLPFRLAGSASAQFWLTRVGGDSTAKMRWDGAALQLDEPTGAWSLPLDALSFEAALEQRARHWSLLTEDFHIERAGQALDLDRAQFDWWGQALRIRASDLGLGALPTLLAAAPGMPQGLRDVLPTLAPEGTLSVVELRLDDLSDPANSWQLRSAVDDLSVKSWRNTPALTGVTGYLELAPGGGQLNLDADDFSMHYPSLYEAPQRYSDALGNVYLAWDATGLHIDSGLMRLTGNEGQAKGLFAVDIPFEERVTGVELELLIGLGNSRVQERGKYLPKTLPGPLLGWLDRSIVAGKVERAGFIWRGSTRPRNYPHMTVQLFLDASDATLTYDPAWPPLTDVTATVWVDDGRTWGRIPRARSEGAYIEDLMVRVLPQSPGALLDISGQVSGPAAAAGALLRDSPLRDLTQRVFVDWDFAGSMEGDLALTLPIGSKSTLPFVDLSLELAGASAAMDQLQLTASRVEGTLRYRTDQGFVGSELRGQVLGGNVVLSALDSIGADGVESTAGAESAEIPERGMDLLLTGEFDTAAVAPWLKQPLLGFTAGSTSFTGELLLSDKTNPRFLLRSELLGVAFDAPQPFGKAPDQALPLALSVPLKTDPVMALTLGERLAVKMRIGEGGLSRFAASVGGAAAELNSCEQRFCLGGTVSALDITQWSDFYRRYGAAADGRAQGNAPAAEPVATADSGVMGPAGLSGAPLSYDIASLEVGELSLATRSFGRARVDLWGEDTLWQGAIESDLVQGSLTREGDELLLLLEHLDLASFGEGEPISLEQVRATMPSMRVDVLELRNEGRVLGGVGFDLDTAQSDGAIYATDIGGDLWGLALDDPQPGMLRWFGSGEGELTALEIDASYRDLGGVMSAAGFSPTLESESGSLSLRLRWPGPPSAYAVANAEGSVELAARNGRLLESGPGALSMISFLNFAEILRGLSLSHMFESGIPFVTASTELYLQRGILEVADLQIDGAASAFAFTGVSDLELGTIDGELLVTLPVANNLPWVAALAAGPAVAAGVFVVSKVFEKQVNRMSSAVYEVSGPMETPSVTFSRLFDDKLTPRSEAPSDSEKGDG